MITVVNIHTPPDKKVIRSLRCGDMVEITGFIYTARDAAHKRLINMLDKNEKLPVDVKGQIIYYAGPCPAKPGQVIGSVGPTTSGRMDAYAPRLIELGLAGMIGKGSRDKSVIDAMIKYGCVYFGATGGAGALIAQCVKSRETIAFDDLGTEAIQKLYVERFPVLTVIDSYGDSMYK